MCQSQDVCSLQKAANRAVCAQMSVLPLPIKQVAAKENPSQAYHSISAKLLALKSKSQLICLHKDVFTYSVSANLCVQKQCQLSSLGCYGLLLCPRYKNSVS